MPTGSILLYGPVGARAQATREVDSPRWATVENIIGGIEIVVVADSCFFDLIMVRRSVQEILRRSGSRFHCLEAILRSILRGDERCASVGKFIFSFPLVDLESARRYLDQEDFDGVILSRSKQVVGQLRRFIEDPTNQGDAKRIIEIRKSALGLI